ncbi:HIT family protein [Streptomyces sp. NBC_01803]|uniref:HIT family protein n=1 Tax=Streptomyces sp. NBC_01803 TaxID=2975946 RepID=UPI002DDA8187|nr:HIT family protein [Streptomyces sp. NBC_01803]WSA43204.1 HIT family protein [Streptomyces sp. NBC_01803]
MDCLFCAIAGGDAPAHRVLEDERVVAFLDTRPLFPGHVLVVPRAHAETLTDLPEPDVGPFFVRVRRIAAAVERGMGADGSFVAANNRISQSVPHFHAHVVPRRRKDGLRGFFWPRGRYADAAEAEGVAARLREALSAGAGGPG